MDQGEVILRFLENLHGKGNTIVLVTHETYLAESAERIIHLKDGLIEKDLEVANRRFVTDGRFMK